jgi:hypothetical protein
MPIKDKEKFKRDVIAMKQAKKMAAVKLAQEKREEEAHLEKLMSD